ncbi:MAG: hypothetical protein A2218_07450 [Elusimicrobia bacterium RIFOXYA2_FULL_53_38]|nr:MAG: hypothetical protein A2218_07450 [Elusimicrobia bacterium RIFOXYA2_FULL_53_38]
MATIRINRNFHSLRNATLVCGRGLGPLSELAPGLFTDTDRVCLVTDRNCFRNFRGFNKMLRGIADRTVIFQTPDGGRAKNFQSLEDLLSFMLKKGFSRRSLVIGAGGGSVTDLAGLGAALYMRGVNWISVPTTLLGQADAGIGGKTAVDVEGVKNIAGAFYQPALTVCDAAFLDTLKEKELRAGAGELIKYALIAPGKLGRVIANNLPGALGRRKKDLAAVVSACAAFKLDLAAKDERDESGRREILNLGHTAGHAFEALSKGRLAHGDAVLWGLRYAAILSYELNLMDRKYAKLIETMLLRTEPPALMSACLDFARFSRLIRLDKKAGTHKNRFLLIKRPGSIQAVNDVAEKTLKKTLKGLKSR